MKEIDTETPVVWPAWCYSGETAQSEDVQQQQQQHSRSPQTLASIINNNNNNNVNNNQKNRGKRKNSSTLSSHLNNLHSGINLNGSLSSGQQHLHQQSVLNSLDKMLSERMSTTTTPSSNTGGSNNNNGGNGLHHLVETSKKFCDTNGLFHEAMIKTENSLELLKYGNNNNSSNSSHNGSGGGGGGGGGGSGSSTNSNEELAVQNNNHTSNTNNSNNNSNNNSSNLMNNNCSANSNIKNERLSPNQSNNNINNNSNLVINGDVQSSASRSRSATPSSYPGTPPQMLNNNENILTPPHHQQQQQRPPQPHEMLPTSRNYSDIMRSLAAKYNNSTTHGEQQQTRSNLFFDPRFALNSSLKSGTTKDTLLSTAATITPPEILGGGKKFNSPNQIPSAAQQLQNTHIMSSLISGLPFPSGVFPTPFIDMSSTQALMTLARAAKEAEIQQLLKGASKRANSSISPRNTSPNNTTNHGNASTAASHQQQRSSYSPNFPSPSGFPSSGSQHHQMTNNNRRASSTSPSSIPVELNTVSPLDLSSSTPVVKRVRIKSPTPGSSRSSPLTSLASNTNQHKASTESISSCTSRQSFTPIPQLQQTNVGVAQQPQRRCQAQSEEINSWSVEQVCEFVGGIDICAEYVQNFRDQQIDGTGLPLLTEEHLTNSLGLKLGPALKLKSVLAKKLGGSCLCASCQIPVPTQSVNTTPMPTILSYTSLAPLSQNNIPRPSSVESDNKFSLTLNNINSNL